MVSVRAAGPGGGQAPCVARGAGLGDRGAATVAAVALCLVLAAGLLVVSQIGRAAILAQRTSAAADLASLAAAVGMLRLAEDPCSQSAQIAMRNAAQQVSCAISHPAAGPEIVVRVRSSRAVWPMGNLERQSRAGLRHMAPDGSAPP